MVNNQSDIDKYYFYVKDLYKAKYINKRGNGGLNHYNEYKAFTEYSDDMQDVDKNIEECNLAKKRKVLIFFNKIIADMISNEKLNLILAELFTGGRKHSISIVFITQSYFRVPKEASLSTKLFFTQKIPNKKELQQLQ